MSEGRPPDQALSETADRAEAERRRRNTVLLSSLGEIVEWFDFMIYLALAPILAKVFFPAADHVSGLFATLGIFAAAYFARPIGALLFGRLGDRSGRKSALVVSALVMAVAKVLEGSLPSYEAIGVAAPILFLAARVTSGVSLGGEYTGTFIMLFESARSDRRALTTSLANVMAGTGILLASGLMALLVATIPDAEMQAWGWRIPFFVGAAIGLVALLIRLRVQETPLFERIRTESALSDEPMMEAVRDQPTGVAVTLALACFNALSYYLVVAFIATYLQSYVGMPHPSVFIITTAAAFLNIVFIPIPGLVSDRIGRRPVMIAAALVFIVFGYPLFLMLASGDFWLTLAAALLFVLPAACFMSPAVTSAAEHLPTRVRYSGFALGYNGGAALFGGTTPLLAAWLIHVTGSLTAPSFYLIAASLVILVVAWRLRETYRAQVE